LKWSKSNLSFKIKQFDAGKQTLTLSRSMNQNPNTNARVSLNGHPTAYHSGETLLQLCRRENVAIPALCFSEQLKPLGSCRLCLVEVDGVIVSSCSTPARAGQQIDTQTLQLQRLRKTVFALLLSTVSEELSPEMIVSMKLCECEAKPVDLQLSAPPLPKVPIRRKPVHSYIQENFERCIVCLRCVKVCEEVVGCNVLGTQKRSIDLAVRPKMEGDWLKSGCVTCGLCLDECPTGAIRAPTLALPDKRFMSQISAHDNPSEKKKNDIFHFLASRISEKFPEQNEGICLHPHDAKALKIIDLSPVEITLKGQTFRLNAILTVRTPEGVVHAMTRNEDILKFENLQTETRVRPLSTAEVKLPPDESFEIR
jgi:predicted molibdopterin-dependent oxidoreductase YjgC